MKQSRQSSVVNGQSSVVDGPLSLYLHIPFCRRRCTYCDFNTYAGLEDLFDSGSAQRVARNALMIADRFRLSPSERQALHHAALLKDLGLVSCPEDMVELGIVPSLEEAVALRKR